MFFRGRLRSGKEYSAYVLPDFDTQDQLNTLRLTTDDSVESEHDDESDDESDVEEPTSDDELYPNDKPYPNDEPYLNEPRVTSTTPPTTASNTDPTATSPATSPAPAATRKQKGKARSKARRSAKRRSDALRAASAALSDPATIASHPTARLLKQVSKKRREEGKAAALEVFYDVGGAAHCTSSWTGLRSAQYTGLKDAPAEPKLGETGLGATPSQESVDRLVGAAGFTYVAWLGLLTIPILDTHRRVVGLLGGRPRDAQWTDVARDAEAAMREYEPKIRLSRHKRRHRRAQTSFAPLTRGVSHGGGQLEPGELRANVTNSHITERLTTVPAFIRIAGFTAALFALWAPELCGYYLLTLAAIRSWNPDLHQNFPGSPFAACTWNFGAAVCAPHLDFANLAWGWCAVTALGNFDPDRGGHLILWDWKLVIRFPPGSTILIPSALVRHSNTRIRKGERRSSFVQYTAGALFRWVDNQYMTNDDFVRLASEEEQAARAERARTRWEHGLNMFSKVD